MNTVIDRQVTRLRKLQNKHSISRARWPQYTDAYWMLILKTLAFETPKSASQIQNELHAAGYYELHINYIRYVLWFMGTNSILSYSSKEFLNNILARVVKSKHSNGRCQYYLSTK